MATIIKDETGRPIEQWENGELIWSLEQELADVAAAAAQAAVEGASGVSGDKQKAADAARKKVEEML